MRKLIFFSFVVLGAAIGLFSALHDDWSVKVVMMTIGAVVGTVLGGALTSTGRRERARRSIEPDDAPLEELDRNYWRDKGVGADPILTHPADPILTRGWTPAA